MRCGLGYSETLTGINQIRIAYFAAVRPVDPAIAFAAAIVTPGNAPERVASPDDVASGRVNAAPCPAATRSTSPAAGGCARAAAEACDPRPSASPPRTLTRPGRGAACGLRPAAGAALCPQRAGSRSVAVGAATVCCGSGITAAVAGGRALDGVIGAGAALAPVLLCSAPIATLRRRCRSRTAISQARVGAQPFERRARAPTRGFGALGFPVQGCHRACAETARRRCFGETIVGDLRSPRCTRGAAVFRRHTPGRIPDDLVLLSRTLRRRAALLQLEFRLLSPPPRLLGFGVTIGSCKSTAGRGHLRLQPAAIAICRLQSCGRRLLAVAGLIGELIDVAGGGLGPFERLAKCGEATLAVTGPRAVRGRPPFRFGAGAFAIGGRLALTRTVLRLALRELTAQPLLLCARLFKPAARCVATGFCLTSCAFSRLCLTAISGRSKPLFGRQTLGLLPFRFRSQPYPLALGCRAGVCERALLVSLANRLPLTREGPLPLARLSARTRFGLLTLLARPLFGICPAALGLALFADPLVRFKPRLAFEFQPARFGTPPRRVRLIGIRPRRLFIISALALTIGDDR